MVSWRILKELRDLRDHPIASCSVAVVDEDIFHWRATILGPPASPFAGGAFLVSIDFTPNYPYMPPRTKIFHPGRHTNGVVCLGMLIDKWSPAITISKVLDSICSLLAWPDQYCFVAREIGDMYKNDMAKYEETARSWTQKYAMGSNQERHS